MLKTLRTPLLAILAAVLLANVAPALAGDEGEAGDDSQPKVIEKRVVVRDDGSEPEVFTWTGHDGDKWLVQGRGYLGVELVEITADLRKHFGADGKAGVLVGQVVADSPAAKAGLEVGDLILAVDSQPVRWSGELGRVVRQKKQGDIARLEVLRDGRALTLDVAVAERDSSPLLLRKIDAGGLEGIEMAPFGPAMRHALAASENPEVMDRLKANMEARAAHVKELEARLKELEARMKELESRLAKGGGR
jgi:membrane-associated protease RseP (regulator of RpoE activity)